jgi:hypothetical protein
MKPVDGKQPDLTLLITTWILFTCFEAMQGHCEQAISHAKQGYALLNQYATDPKRQPFEMEAFAAELDQLCLMMQRLQTQSKGLMEKEGRTLGGNIGLGDAPKPEYFETLQDAQVALEKKRNQLSMFFLDLDLNDDFYNMVRDSPHQCLSQTAWLEAWEQAFSQLLARKQAELTPLERRGAMVLKVHHLVCEILSNVTLTEGGDANSDLALEAQFDFNNVPGSRHDDAGFMMHGLMNSHSPCEALNPCLFTGSDSLDAQERPIATIESSTELGFAPPLFDQEMRYQSATLSPRDA